MARNPSIYNEGGVHRFIDYVSQIPDFLKGEDDVVVLLQVLSDYLNNAYRNITVVEKFEFKFIAIESNLSIIQRKTSELMNLLVQSELRGSSVLFLSKPQGNPYSQNRPVIMEYIKFNGSLTDISTQDGVLNSSIISPSIRSIPIINGDKFFVSFTNTEYEAHSGVYYYDIVSNQLVIDPYTSSQDPFTNTVNEPIQSVIGLVPRIIEFKPSNVSEIHTRKATNIDGLDYYNVSFTATISNVTDITSIYSIDRDIDNNGTTERILIDYYDIVSNIPSNYDESISMQFGAGCDNFNWTYGYGKGLFYARELTKSNTLTDRKMVNYTDPYYENNTSNYKIKEIVNISGTSVTVTVDSTHQLNVGDLIYISDTVAFNGYGYEVLSIIDQRKFTIRSSSLGHEYTGIVVLSNFHYSDLINDQKTARLILNYSEKIGTDSISDGDLLYRVNHEYELSSVTCNTSIDMNIATQSYLVSDDSKYIVGDTIMVSNPTACVCGLSEGIHYKIIDMPRVNGRLSLKLQGVSFTTVPPVSDPEPIITFTKVNMLVDEADFDVNTQEFIISSTYGISSGDKIQIFPLYEQNPTLVSTAIIYTVESVNHDTNGLKLHGVRHFTAGASLQFAVVKLIIDTNILGRVYTHNSRETTGSIILAGVHGDFISSGCFIKNNPFTYNPIIVKSASVATPWTYDVGYIYAKNAYVSDNGKRYKVLKTHKSNSVKISNSEYFILDMSDITFYDKKAIYNPYMNGMYLVKSLGFSEEPDYNVGYDKLYSDLYIKKVQDLSLKFGQEQRQFVFDPRYVLPDNLSRNGFMEIIKGNGDYDAVDGSIIPYINARSQDSMLLKGADWILQLAINTIESNNSIVTLSTTQLHQLQTGVYVTISGITEPEFNGRYKITVISPNTIIYEVDGIPDQVGNITPDAIIEYNNDIICKIESIYRSGTFATVTTTTAHGYKSDITVDIEGADQTAYNGNHVITVINATTFSYQVAGGVATPATSSSELVSIYIPQVDDFISVENQLNDSYNGIYVVAVGDWVKYDTTKISVPVTLFSKQNLFDITSVNPTTCTELNARQIKSLTYLGLRTVQVELYDNHNYSIGGVVTITGASQGIYNGRYEITAIPSSNTFYYHIKGDSTPASPATAQNGLVLLCQSESWYKYEISNIEWQQKSSYNSSYIGIGISKIWGDGSIITINTANPHGFTAGNIINISNTENYNGTFTVYSVINSTTFILIGAVIPTELNGNVYKGITIPLNDNKNDIAQLFGEYKFKFANGTTYSFVDGDIIELHDQCLTRENGLYRVVANAMWTRLDKKLVLKVREITVDARENDTFDALEDDSIPYVYTRYTDSDVDAYIQDNFQITHQIYKIDARYATNVMFLFEKIDNIDTAGQLHTQYNAKYDYNSVAPRHDMKSDFVGVGDLTYPLVEKFERLAYLKDPKVIDISVIEYLARFMGYDITQLKSDIDESIVYTTQEEREKALRETIQNLPQYYAIKGTESSLELLLLTFGIVGKLVTYWTRLESPYDELIPDYNVRSTQFMDNLNGIQSNFVPTPHFKLKVDIEGNFDNQLIESDSRRLTNQIHIFKPINTVFDGIYRFLQCKAKSSVTISNMRSRGRLSANVGFDDVFDDNMVTNDCFDNGNWNVKTSNYLISIDPSSIQSEVNNNT